MKGFRILETQEDEYSNTIFVPQFSVLGLFYISYYYFSFPIFKSVRYSYYSAALSFIHTKVKRHD